MILTHTVCVCVFRFDFVLDAVGGSTADDSFSLLKKWTNAKLVTIVTPLLRNVDSMGFVPGAAQSVFALGSNVLRVSLNSGDISPASGLKVRV